MRIVDLLKKESIQLNAAPKSKSEAIDMLVDLQVKGGSDVHLDVLARLMTVLRKKFSVQ